MTNYKEIVNQFTSVSSGIVLSLLSILLSILVFINCPVSIHSFFQSVFATIDLWSVKEIKKGKIGWTQSDAKINHYEKTI